MPNPTSGADAAAIEDAYQAQVQTLFKVLVMNITEEHVSGQTDQQCLDKFKAGLNIAQRAKQLACWFEPFVKLRAPKMFNLRRDPFERADHNSNTYWDWLISHAYVIYEMQGLVAQQIQAFLKFPPRQKPASFNLDAVLAHLQDASGGGNH